MNPYKIDFTLCEFLSMIFYDYAGILKDKISVYDLETDSRERIEYFKGIYGSQEFLIAMVGEYYHTLVATDIVKFSSLFKIENATLQLIDNRIDDVFKLFVNRNWDNYILTYKTFKKYEDIEVIEIKKPSARIINNVLSILEMTKDRYIKLLDMYQASTSDLLAKLQRSSSGSADNKTFTNVTPQTPAVNTEAWFEYVNNAVKNISSASDTTSEDKDYLIDKINSIQEKYRNVLKDWSNELNKLCWESE